MRVLVVEDEPLIATSILWELSDAGHEVIGPAATADEAGALAQGAELDLALVDINLQGRGDGIELAQALRRRGVPSVFVTGQVNEARQNCEAAIGLVLKPFPFESLDRVVQSACDLLAGRTPAAMPRCLEVFETSLETWTAPAGVAARRETCRA